MDHESFRLRQRRIRLTGLTHVPLNVAYTDLGSGAPLVLLHGIPTWSYLYNDVIDRLAEHRRVIAPDF
jgi:pimeloyl-ACP methyl ester carboxylesterase